MKTQKNNLLFLALSLIIVFTACCSPANTEEGNVQKRIKGKESTIYDNGCYHIIEVDGTEYISNGEGGIHPLIQR